MRQLLLLQPTTVRMNEYINRLMHGIELLRHRAMGNQTELELSPQLTYRQKNSHRLGRRKCAV